MLCRTLVEKRCIHRSFVSVDLLKSYVADKVNEWGDSADGNPV